VSVASRPVGRRKRNEQKKLDRITAAAGELIAVNGVGEVTTQQIADKADAGTKALTLCLDQG
jgi:AcrR family transcriptional regulator